MSLSNLEIKVIISLIDSYQFDGAEWGINGIKLNDLKAKLKQSLISLT